MTIREREGAPGEAVEATEAVISHGRKAAPELVDAGVELHG